MPRALKPMKVGYVTNGATGADVFLDRDKKVFFVAVGVERAEHAEFEQAKVLGNALLAQETKYEWEPIIVVDAVDVSSHRWNHEPGEHEISMKFEFCRCERARDPRPKSTRKWLTRDHADDFEATHPDADDRRERENSTRVHHRDKGSGSDDVVIPYDQDVWDGLLKIEQAVADSRMALHNLIESKGFAGKLRAVGSGSCQVPPLFPEHVRVNGRRPKTSRQ
jgi:hypothetical protein